MTGKTKVLHVLAELRPSGAESMLRCAAPYFREQGVEAQILSLGQKEGGYAQPLRDAGYDVHHLPMALSPIFFFRLFAFFRRGKFDAIHLHVEKASFYVGLLALMSSPVVVRTIHAIFDFAGTLRWRRAVQRRVLAWLGLVYVAISGSVRDNERSRFGINAVLVENWYNSDLYRPCTATERADARRQFAIDDDKFVIVSVGNCADIKNHSDILKALSGFPQGVSPVYLHVGEEDSVCSERKLVDQLDLPDVVRFLGSRTDVDFVLRTADLFVMPSKWEGFGIAALEALAVGVPVLFSRVGGLRDFGTIFPGVEYCEPVTASVRDTLHRLAGTDQDTLRRAVALHPEIASSRYGIARGVRQYVGLYKHA